MFVEQKAVEPTLLAMQENVQKSFFIDIIESKAEVWQMKARFENAYSEFKKLVDNA